MPKNIVKKTVLAVAGLVMAGVSIGVITDSRADAQSLPPVEKMTAERSLGNQNSKVTVIEYASLTCPHCAAFHRGPWREIKKEYVDTGKIKFIFRDFPLDRIALAASMIARCTPEERYFGVINLMFETQDTWRNAANPQAALESIGRLAGMPSETLQVCVQNRAVFDAVMKQRNDGDKKFKIESTPTILVNGQKINGSLDIGRFREVVDQALADARQ